MLSENEDEKVKAGGLIAVQVGAQVMMTGDVTL